jgi:hypothetical protein
LVVLVLTSPVIGLPQCPQVTSDPAELIGRLPVIASLDALGVDDLARILKAPKDSLIAQFRKLVRFHGADLVFTDAAIREFARIALERGAAPVPGSFDRWSRRSWKAFCSPLSRGFGR